MTTMTPRTARRRVGRPPGQLVGVRAALREKVIHASAPRTFTTLCDQPVYHSYRYAFKSYTARSQEVRERGFQFCKRCFDLSHRYE